MVVVVTHESNMASYFSEEVNLNSCNAYMCYDVARPSSSGLGDLLELQKGQILRTFTIFPTTSTTSVHLGFKRDYNYHSAFRDVLRHHA